LNSDQKALFGVFDGHGGREVAVWCQEHYEQILNRDYNTTHSEQERKEWLRKSFLNVDEDLKKPEHLKRLQELRKEKPPNKPPLLQILEQSKPKDAENNEEDVVMDTVGCTANVIFIDKDINKIYVVNAGDSRCTMGKAGKAVEMSIDHKPESQIEIDRIEKAGSVITEGRVDGNLNLTRSLGDLKYKQRENLTPEEQAITSNPDVYEFEYSEDIDFIIMGCDGIWEKKSNEEMVEYVYAKLRQNKELKQIVSELLLDTIAPSVAETQGIGCDNMTCILIKFNK
jgi:serine/threonine protein phosphatase PrpC